MRKLVVPLASLLFTAVVAAAPAHAGLGSLLKAATKAGTVTDDAARAGVHAGAHADDAARVGGHVDDGALVADTAAHGEDARGVRGPGALDDAAVAKDGDSIWSDLAQGGAELALDAAGGATADSPENKATSPVDKETLKHARRLAVLAELEKFAFRTNDAALETKCARIREKERVRHLAALMKMSANSSLSAGVDTAAPGKRKP